MCGSVGLVVDTVHVVNSRQGPQIGQFGMILDKCVEIVGKLDFLVQIVEKQVIVHFLLLL